MVKARTVLGQPTDQAEATPDHEPVRPTFTLTEAAQAAGTSRSTIKRKLAAGEFPGAAKDADGVWRFSPGDLLAAGLKLRTPAEAGRSRRDDEDQDDDEAAELLDRIADLERLLTVERVRREAAEQVAVEREKRAETAVRALLMLEARPSPVRSHQPDAVRPSVARISAPSDGRFRIWVGSPSARILAPHVRRLAPLGQSSREPEATTPTRPTTG